MHEFTELEKQIIDLILYYHENKYLNCLYNILFDNNGVFGITSEFYLNFNKENEVGFFVNEELLSSKRTNYRELNDFFSSKILIFATTIDFIQYLIDQKYINVIMNNKIYNDEIKPNQGYIPYVGMSRDLENKLIQYERMLFIPTQKLVTLKKSAYIDSDGIKENNEKRIKSITLVLTIVSILIAAGSLITSITVAKNSSTKSNRKIEVILDSKSIAEITDELEKKIGIKRIIIYDK